MLSANLDRSAYCPGESIIIKASVANNTSREMDGLSAKLIQKVEFNAKRKGGAGKDERDIEHTVAKISCKCFCTNAPKYHQSNTFI